MFRKRTADFAALVHHLLVAEKRRPVKEVAKALGMKYATFYARMIGRVPFDPDEINALLREVPDHRLVDCLLAETQYIAVPRPPAGRKPDARENTGIVVHALQSAAESFGILREMTLVLDDGGLDPEARDRITAHIHEAERGLAALRWRLAHHPAT